jgi:hypothetical protein
MMSGPKAGRKTFVENADVIECRNGTDKSKACDSFATLNTKCLFCDPNHGCADHINTCRYRMISDDTDEDALEQTKKYDKCHPGTLLGGDSCPIELRNEFAKSTSKDEEQAAKAAKAATASLESVETIADNSSSSSNTGGGVIVEEINEVVVSKKKKQSSSDNGNNDDVDEDVDEKNDTTNDEEENNKRRLLLRYRRRLS